MTTNLQALGASLLRLTIGNPVRWYKARVIRGQLTELRGQLDTLHKHMAIDAVLAEHNKALRLKDPGLAARMSADKLLERTLASDIAALTRALAELEGQP